MTSNNNNNNNNKENQKEGVKLLLQLRKDAGRGNQGAINTIQAINEQDRKADVEQAESTTASVYGLNLNLNAGKSSSTIQQGKFHYHHIFFFNKSFSLRKLHHLYFFLLCFLLFHLQCFCGVVAAAESMESSSSSPHSFLSAMRNTQLLGRRRGGEFDDGTFTTTTTTTTAAWTFDRNLSEEEEEEEENSDDDDIDCSMRLLFMETAQKSLPWRKNNMKDVYDALEIETRCKKSSNKKKNRRRKEEEGESSSSSDNDNHHHHHHHHEWKATFKVSKATTTDDDSSSTKTSTVGRTTTSKKSWKESPQQPVILSKKKKMKKKYFFVCPVNGNDNDENHVGNITHPFASLERAIQASREYRKQQQIKNLYLQQQQQQRNNGTTNTNTIHVGSSGSTTKRQRMVVMLREGIHFLNNTIVLTPNDSDLTIRPAYENETVWISGGVFIDSKTSNWKRVDDSKSQNIWVTDMSSFDLDDNKGVTGLFTTHPHERMTLARYPNADVENWDDRNRYVSSHVVDEWMFPPFGEIPKFYTIDLSTHDNNPTGHIKNDSSMEDYNKFGTGQGGACSTVWGDEPSYWCSNISAGGWAEVDKAAALAGRMNIPIGMILLKNDTSAATNNNNTVHTRDDDEKSVFERIKGWNNPTGGIVHVSHSQGWAWHMFNISHIISNTSTATVYFDKGGWQGGRNWECVNRDGHMGDCNGEDKKLKGGSWYVEGIGIEELDAPEEFYYDHEKKLLYFYPRIEGDNECCSVTANTSTNTTKKTHQGGCHCIPDLIATNLQTLIQVQGTKDNPVRGIRLKRLGFRDTAKTYMEQWSAPSGGDWALHRGGAVHIEGSIDTTISDSIFRRLDGNAIMLSGYCRNTTVTRSEFSWIGNGALATWGDTENGYDATGGAQPRHSLIELNVMKELGLYQKQSSGWGQNKACQNTIQNNVMFNLPRAAINFNDGLGGGNLVKGNVIFNTCRESGDHGPINSWDRMPFLTDTSGNSPSFTPASTHTTQNLILANYGASQGFDNDDGSSWYQTYSNVYYSADGFKMDYGGHDSIFANNLVYAQNRHCFGTGSFLKGHQDKFYNNTCIVVDERSNPPQNHIGTLYQCSTDGMNPTNNRYFTINGNATWRCPSNSDPLTLDEMQKMGFELNSTIDVIPPVKTIISWARIVLGLYHLYHHPNDHEEIDGRHHN